MKSVKRSNGRASARAQLLLNGGVMSLAFGIFMLPSAAFAQNECGTPPVGGGTVTCTATNNPYPNGINYNAQPQDLTVVLEDDVAVATDTPATRGVVVSATGTNAVSVSGAAASVSTTGANSNAVEVTSLGGPVSVTIGDVQTSGSLSGGVRAVGGTDGDVAVTTGDVTTTGTDGSTFFFLPNSTAVTAIGAGTGNVTVNTGSLSTAGVGARGVNASAGEGDVVVNTGAVTTTGANAIGVAADSATGNVSVTTTGAVETSGDSAQGIYATARSGSASVNATSVATSGYNATGIQALSGTGGTDVSFDTVTTGNTFATGVIAGSTGGDVNVHGGSVTATGTSSSAIYGYSDTGSVKVTTTGDVASSGRGGFGIYATSDTGDVEVRANNVSTIAASADDTATSRSAIYARGANASVTTTGTVAMAGNALYGGPADAVVVQATDGDASATVRNVTSTGATSRAVFVTATGNATANINGPVSTTGAGTDAVRVDAGDAAKVNIREGGSITSAGGNLISVNSVTGTTINNAGKLGSAENGYAIIATGGPVTINNAGTMESDILLTDGNDTVNNTGRFDLVPSPDFGLGTDVFNNQGTVYLVPGNTVTLTGLETFNNSGLVDLRNGVVGDRITIPGIFTGSGASSLGLDVDLGSTTADRLVVGGAATGSTTVLLHQTGTQALFNPGTVLVEASEGSSPTAFTLGATGSMDMGLVRYQIRYNSTDDSYSLIGGPSDAAFRTLDYVEGVRSLWLNSADVVSSQLQARRDSLWANGDGAVSGKLWMQMYGSVEDRGNGGNYTAFGVTRSVNTGYKQDYFGGQLGLDFGGGSGERGGFAFGITGGYTNSSLNFDQSSDRLSFDSLNGGVYASFSSGNLFINGLAKYDYYWAKARSIGGGFDRSFNGGVYGGRVEAGIRLGSDTFFVEPAASVSYVKSDMDDFASQGTTVSFDDDYGLQGRAGGRIGTQFDMGGAKASIYAGGNYVHEFQAEDGVAFSGGGQTLRYVNNRLGDFGEAKLGISINQTSSVSGFIEGTYKRSFKRDSSNRADVEGAGGRAGLRLRF